MGHVGHTLHLLPPQALPPVSVEHGVASEKHKSEII